MRKLLWMGLRWLIILVLLLLISGIAYAIVDLLAPKTYFVSRRILRDYRAAGIPEPVLKTLEADYGQEFPSKDAFRAGMRRLLGEETFVRHADTLVALAGTNHCRPTTHPRRTYQISSSRGHRLYDSIRTEPVLTREQVPVVPTNLVRLPGREGWLVLGQRGGLFHYGPDFTPRWQAQIPGVFELSGDQGALGLVADPAFPSNRFVYVSFVDTPGKVNIVQRFTMSQEPAAVVESLVDVIRFPKDDRSHYHGIAGMMFDAAGALLIAVGDPTDHAQRAFQPEGKLLRLRPGHGPEGGYTLPDYGPAEWLRLVLTGGNPLYAAMGLRAPFQSTAWGERFIIGDVGGNGPHSWEKINLYERPGQNFAWGSCSNPDLMGGDEPPIIAYRRGNPAAADDMPPVGGMGGGGSESDDEELRNRLSGRMQAAPGDIDARTVVVGLVYPQGGADPYGDALDGRLLYGDFYMGFVRGALLGPDGRVLDDVYLLREHFISGMSLGDDGYIYATTAVGEFGVLRLIPRP